MLHRRMEMERYPCTSPSLLPPPALSPWLVPTGKRLQLWLPKYFSSSGFTSCGARAVPAPRSAPGSGSGTERSRAAPGEQLFLACHLPNSSAGNSSEAAKRSSPGWKL